MPGISRIYSFATFLAACMGAYSVGIAGQASSANAASDPVAGVDRVAASAPSQESRPATPAAPAAKRPLDRSGHKRTGKASVYANKLAGKTMADGTTMQSHGDNAASKTLPLGTTAQVKNLKTGKTAVVTIRDRGPYVKGRIIDLSPSTAQKIGIEREEGVSKVEVSPIAVPQSDGSSKPGVASPDSKGAADSKTKSN